MDTSLKKTDVQNHVERLKKTFSGPISEGQLQFLLDVEGFIQFCVRNGLDFMTIVGTLGQDINGLVARGLELPTKDGFLPKVTGYAEINATEVGEPNDEELT